MYSSVLVPVDLDEPSSWRKALPAARRLAESFDASLTLCTIVPDSATRFRAQTSSEAIHHLLDEARTGLVRLTQELGLRDIEIEVGMGSVPGGIIAIAENVGADLIVLSSHRPEMKDWLIGANAVRLVRHAPCSVMVVRD